jgi:pantoate--beta-alanine ligase
MREFARIAPLQRFLNGLRQRKKRIGFVPTMGYLHEGHLSLVRLSNKENDATVVSIFVNALQFGRNEDFSRYPRNLKRDRRLLGAAAADVLFAPSAGEMYQGDFQTSVTVGGISRPLCGVSRPTHFSGVATVVLKLLNIVNPETLYLGQKDYQQYRVVSQMAKDLHLRARVCMAPIMREKDGLAMSSRNVLLSGEERRDATLIYQALREGRTLISSGERRAPRVLQVIRRILGSARLGRIDYAEIVDAETLAPVVELNEHSKALLAVAMLFKRTRLIDNILMEV